MKKKIINLAVLATLMSSTTLFAASNKTIDFYSTNGNNRYSISGEIKDLDLEINDKTLLIKEADSDAYVTLNNNLPYHVRFLENDISVYQVIEGNKGKTIKYKDKEVKILGFQGTNIVAESNEGVVFIPVENVVLPKDKLKDSKKGLQATFKNSIKDTDKLFYSQEERGLRYTNTFSARINENKINVAHYFNIVNSTKKTFEDVYLNFFLSQTNIANDRMPRAMPVMAMKSNMESVSNIALPEPDFIQDDVQSLKTISIKDPVTIYQNVNKIKYTDKTYSMEQYSKIHLRKNHIISLGNYNKEDTKTVGVEGSKLNKLYKENVDNYRDNLLRGNIGIDNIISIKLNKEDVFPAGKIDIYENVKGNDKLIVSTQIGHTDGEKLEVLKNNKGDLKIRDVVFKKFELKDVTADFTNNFNVELLIKSVVIENIGNEVAVIEIFDKKYTVKPNSKLTINA